jgi:hypothetical protein
MVPRNVVLLVVSAVALCSLTLAAVLAAEKDSPDPSQALIQKLLESYTQGVAEQKKSPPGSPAEQIQKLQEQITQLEARVKNLETEAALCRLRANVVHSDGPTGQPLPKGWRQREFNGRPYYIVPLETGMK